MSCDMLGRAVKALVKLAENFSEALGSVCDLLEKLVSGEGREYLIQFKRFLRKEQCWRGVILRLISGGEKLTIDACDGSEILAEARDVFDKIEHTFSDHFLEDEPFKDEETSVAVFDVIRYATYSDMFTFAHAARDSRFSQAQIIGFVRKHRKWLRADGFTCFLYSAQYKFSVACVQVNSCGKIELWMDSLSNPIPWNEAERVRVVIPI